MIGKARLIVGTAPLFEAPHLSKLEYLRKARQGGMIGLPIAMLVMGAWVWAVGTSLFAWDIASAPWWQTFGLAVLTTWLYSGIFITAHDAMHSCVAPGYPRLNNAIGWVCVKAFAMFDYKVLLHAHWAHHRHVALPGEDPDFHDGKRTSFGAWYVKFMLEYLTIGQLVQISLLFNVLLHALHVPLANMMLLWVLPSLVSSVQLFYFGTYLPHLEPKDGYADCHRATTHSQSLLWAFFSCFFFGLHWEHHAYPFVPWWRLPLVSKQSVLPFSLNMRHVLVLVFACGVFFISPGFN